MQMGPLPCEGTEVRYLTDDRDSQQRHELVLYQANNGDWYLMVVPEGHRFGPTVRFCTSGGASSRVPGLTTLLANIFALLLVQDVPC